MVAVDSLVCLKIVADTLFDFEVNWWSHVSSFFPHRRQILFYYGWTAPNKAKNHHFVFVFGRSLPSAAPTLYRTFAYPSFFFFFLSSFNIWWFDIFFYSFDIFRMPAISINLILLLFLLVRDSWTSTGIDAYMAYTYEWLLHPAQSPDTTHKLIPNPIVQ